MVEDAVAPSGKAVEDAATLDFILTACLTILLCEPEADIMITWPLDPDNLTDPSNYSLIRLRFASAD